MLFVSRSDAGLAAPTRLSSKISPQHLTAHWAGPSVWGGKIGDHARCSAIWRSWQKYHMSTRGWADIAYTSGVCPHGYVFDGRGPQVRTAANGTNKGNSRSYATCYIGGTGDPFTIEAQSGFIAEAARLRVPLNKVHADWRPTGCPGPAITGWVRSGAQPPPPPTKPPKEDEVTQWRSTVASQLLTRLQDNQPTITADSHPLRIKLIQQILNLLSGAGLEVDGIWGPATFTAMVNFQRFFGINVGFADDQTKFVMALALQKIAQSEAP